MWFDCFLKIKIQVIIAGIPTIISLNLLPIATEKETILEYPTKSPTITNASSWIPIAEGMKKAADLIIEVTDSIIITSVTLASTPIIQKKI